MIVIWTTQKDKMILKQGLFKLLKKYKIKHTIMITKVLVTSDQFLVLALGDECRQILADAGIVPKNRTINSLRNKIHEHQGTKYMLSYDPDCEQYLYSQYVDLKWDLKLARRYDETGNLAPKVGTYTEVVNFKAFYTWTLDQNNKTGKRVEVAFDLETMGLDPYAPGKEIVSVNVCAEEGRAYCIYLEDGKLTAIQRMYIEYILNSEWIMTEGANFKYDLLWMRYKWKIKCTNFTLDTHLAGSLIDENVSSSLNNHAKTWTEMGGYDDAFNNLYDKDHMETVPRADLVQYGCGDVDACFRVGRRVRRYFKKHTRLRDFYLKLLHPTSMAFHEIEALGCWVDIEHYSALRVDLVAMMKKARKKALELVPKTLFKKHMDPKKPEFNLSKPAFLKDFLFGTDDQGNKLGLGLKPKLFTLKAKAQTWQYASTAANHLALLRTSKKALPFLDCIEEYGTTSKTLSTYVDGFLKHLRSDGRFHPSFFLFKGTYTGDDEVGTVTGRTSVKAPAMQTITKRGRWAKPLRGAFVAPKGYIILGCDYTEGELKVAADRSEDEEMLDAFSKGISIHAKTAANINNISIDEFNSYKQTDKEKYDYLRYGAKAGNFGLIFGMQAPGFQNYARDTFGVHWSLKEAEAIRNKHFELYSGLLPWHTREIKEAHKNGFVVNPLGRVRHLPMLKSDDWGIRSKEERRAINSPVQSCLNDLLFYTLVMVYKKFGKWIEKKDILPFLTMHDAVYFYVRKKYAVDWAHNITHTMSHLPLKDNFGWEPKVTFNADAEIGTNLATMEPVILN